MIRQVYSLPSADNARSAVAALRGAGFTEEHISLAARSDIELERLPETYAEDTHDFNGGLKRGLVIGGGTGLLAGLVATSIPSFGVTGSGVAWTPAAVVSRSTIRRWCGSARVITVPVPPARAVRPERCK